MKRSRDQSSSALSASVKIPRRGSSAKSALKHLHASKAFKAKEKIKAKKQSARARFSKGKTKTKRKKPKFIWVL